MTTITTQGEPDEYGTGAVAASEEATLPTSPALKKLNALLETAKERAAHFDNIANSEHWSRTACTNKVVDSVLGAEAILAEQKKATERDAVNVMDIDHGALLPAEESAIYEQMKGALAETKRELPERFKEAIEDRRAMNEKLGRQHFISK